MYKKKDIDKIKSQNRLKAIKKFQKLKEPK